MVILLPRQRTGLARLEEALTAPLLRSWLAALEPADVDLAVPRFTVQFGCSIRPSLESLGMAAAFDRKRADLSGISAANDLYVEDVIHQATVEVDEKGTIATAATAVRVDVKSEAKAPREPVQFYVDHPFLFLIRHPGTGFILFLGRVTDPRAPAS
jgi:serpin B